jgi:hypothetical protein
MLSSSQIEHQNNQKESLVAPSEDSMIPKDCLIEDVPIIDVEKFLNKDSVDQETWMAECKKVADSLHKFGILIFRDPRASE